MKFSSFLFIALSIFICSCSKTVVKEIKESEGTSTKQKGGALELTLMALDLSEDANPISTNDDELVLLIYSINPKKELSILILNEYFMFDSTQISRSFNFGDSSLQGREVAIILLEMDSKLSVHQIEPIVRLHLPRFLSYDPRSTPDALNDLLGDDDLLGVHSINTVDLKSKHERIEFKGRRLFDSYHYKLSLLSPLVK